MPNRNIAVKMFAGRYLARPETCTNPEIAENVTGMMPSTGRSWFVMMPWARRNGKAGSHIQIVTFRSMRSLSLTTLLVDIASIDGGVRTRSLLQSRT